MKRHAGRTLDDAVKSLARVVKKCEVPAIII